MRQPPEPAPLAIGIDLGATKIAAALVNAQGEPVAEARALTHAATGIPAVMARLADVVEELLNQTTGPVLGIGIGTPGLVDGAAGIVRNAVNLGWHEVALAHLVKQEVAARTRINLPVYVENDANGQAVGELVFGAGRGQRDFMLLTLGSGLGGGLIANGRLVAGATHTAAELGHLSLDPSGRPCACGLRGCVETVVSGPGLVKTVRELTATLQAPWAMADDLRAEDVITAARGSDPLALAAVNQTARWLGMALAAVVAITNPATVIIGGGLGLSAFDLLLPGVRSELARRTLAQSHRDLLIVPAQVTSSAVGAAALVWQAQTA